MNQLPPAPDPDLHYLRHVTALGERHHVVAHRPIVTHNGIKLLDVGARIDRSILDKLMHHKLLPPLDECLTVENAVSPERLRQDLLGLLVDGSPLTALVSGPGGAERLLAVFARLSLPPPLAFKLTVAREERPDLYRHTLEVTLAALVLTTALKRPDGEVLQAVAAAVFHDIGLLHVDPGLLDKGRNLAEQELHHLYSHPVTGHLILTSFPELSPKIAAAVLEHHERLDGSGYPRHLASPDLGRLGQLLAVAELAATLLAQPSPLPPAERLSIVLRMNRGKFDDEYTGRLTEILLAAAPPAAAGAGSVAEVLAPLVQVAGAIEEWRSISAPLRATAPARSPVAVVDRRMIQLQHSLADMGVDLQYWTMMDSQVDQDPATLAELRAASREALWQLRAISRECQSRWRQQMSAGVAMPAELSRWVRRLDGDEPA